MQIGQWKRKNLNEEKGLSMKENSHFVHTNKIYLYLFHGLSPLGLNCDLDQNR